MSSVGACTKLHDHCATMPPPSSLSQPSKRRKTSGDDTLAALRALETKVTDAASSNSSLNPLADLLELTVSYEDPQLTLKGIYAMYRVFVILIDSGRLGPHSDEEAKVVREWISDRLSEFSDFLFGLLKDEETTLRVCFIPSSDFVPPLIMSTDIVTANPVHLTETLVELIKQVVCPAPVPCPFLQKNHTGPSLVPVILPAKGYGKQGEQYE